MTNDGEMDWKQSELTAGTQSSTITGCNDPANVFITMYYETCSCQWLMVIQAYVDEVTDENEGRHLFSTTDCNY